MRRSRAIFGHWRLSGCDKDALFDLEEDSDFDEFVLPNAGVHLEVMRERPAHLWMCVNGVHLDVDYAHQTVTVRNECAGGWRMVVDS